MPLSLIARLGIGLGLALGIAPFALADSTPPHPDHGNPPATRQAQSTRPAEESFILHCSGCHRDDGSGIQGIAPDLRKIDRFLQTQAGRDYLGRVPGVAQAPINSRELSILLNWILTELAHAQPNPPYTEAEIELLRADPLRDPLAERAAVLAQIE